EYRGHGASDETLIRDLGVQRQVDVASVRGTVHDQVEFAAQSDPGVVRRPMEPVRPGLREMESLAPPPVPGLRPHIVAAQPREGSNLSLLAHLVRAMKTARLGLAFLPASTIRLLRVHEIACAPVVRGWPSLVKGAGLRILSRRGSQVQILPHASCRNGMGALLPSTILPNRS